MLNESLLKKLRQFASSLGRLGVSSTGDGWRGLADAADGLIGDFLQAGESDAQDLLQLLRDVANSLAKGMIADPAEGVKAVQTIVNVLKGLETPEGLSESLRKQAMAEVKLFFRDVQKEESRVDEESAFEDDDERREMIMSIESRIDELDGDLLNLNPPVGDSEQVRAIFRQFHTLKGEGAICGIKSVSEFCHGVETEIEDARSGNLILTAEIVATLQELSGIIRLILAGQSREEIGEEMIQSLMDELRLTVAEAKGIAANGKIPQGREEPAAAGDGTGDQFADFFSGFAPPPEKPESAASDEAGGEPEAAVLSGNLDAADFLSALGDIVKPEAAAGVNDAKPSAAAQEPVKPKEKREEKPEAGKTGFRGKTPADTVIESGDLFGGAGETAALKKELVEKKVEETKVRAISVDVSRLDDLLEIVGEVSLLGAYITTKLAGQDGLSLQTNNLSRACGRLQELANSLRMTSIRPLFMTVRRVAAEAARASRKMIEINMKGIDTQVDRSIVENLSAALIHIIRNAVDHGIEPADVRRQAGKQERGAINISAYRTNSDIAIELGDDGGGFDLKTIHDKAVGMGKIAPNAKLNEEELADLVFLPGLSTAKKVTGLSGRGVGMEIVRNSIDNLRGKVEIRTAEGKGTTVRMRFPLMVTAMDAMLVRVGKNILVIPVAQVRECFRPKPSDIGSIDTRGTIVTIRGVILPVLFLGREFGIESEASVPEDGVLVVVETGEMLAAVLVDETLGSSQVVIRSLDGPLANSGLVAGAAVLPDGRIGLVIETASLTARVATSASKAFNDAGSRQADSSRQIDTVYIGSNQVGMIDFNIVAPDGQGGNRTHVFAINAFKTREFVPISPLRSIPNSPTGFVGVMMLRNRTVPVVHMGLILGLLSEEERRPEWEQIALICEFSGQTVGFLVSSVERVSYISWSDIMPPPSTGGLIQLDYVVGTILMSKLEDKKGKKSVDAGQRAKAGKTEADDEAQVAFVLDFERIVGNAIQLYGDMGTELGQMASDPKKTVNILLVEDSPLIRKRTKKALSSAGINVLEAGDGQEAWERIEAMRQEADEAEKSIFSLIDLVLSDIEMPRMDGYTLTYNIKHDAKLRVLPVLLHSSITNDSMISRATEVEADGFIPKCDPKELADQLRKYL